MLPDKRHPSLAGTYLAACVASRRYRQIAGRQLLHRRHRSADGKFLQEIAWETVQDYYGK